MFKFYTFLSFLIFLSFKTKLLIAQQETWTWYLGRFGGVALKFNDTNSDPTVLTGFSSVVDEACGSISDSVGNLLFYSNGIQIFDANHNQMPQGTGLLADGSSTQGIYIVKQPGNNRRYFLFTTPGGHAEGDLTVGFRYTVVDMDLPGNGSLAAPLGDVIPAEKNVLLFTPSTEKCAVTLHNNCKDIWVMGHRYGTNEFYAYLLTETGLNTTPVITPIDPEHSGTPDKARGNMCFSPNGQRFAYILHDYDTRINIDLFDFDNSTGIVSNRYNIPITLTNTDGYGVCFSPNSNVLYATYFIDGKIVQYDLNAADIAGSGIVLNSDPTGFGKPKLAPNGKIYIPRLSTNYLSTINNPDIVGVGANYTQTGIDLGSSGTVWLSTPEMFVASDEPIIIDSIVTQDANCSPNGTIIIYATGGSPPLKYSIDSGGSFYTNNQFDSLSSGNYQIVVEDANGCYLRDSVLLNSNSIDILDAIQISPDTCYACRGQITLLSENGTEPYEYSINNGANFFLTNQFTNICSGNYSIIIRDANGCQSLSNIAVPNVDLPIEIEISPPDPVCVFEDSIPLISNVPGGTWMGTGVNPITGQFFPNIPGTGIHQVIYSILGDCGGSDTINIEVTEKVDAIINPVPFLCNDGELYQITANPPGGTWIGTGVDNTGNFDPTIGEGNYNIQYISNAGACGDTASVLIEVTSPPTLEISANNNFGCPPLEVNFNYTGSSLIDNCIWDFGNGQTSNNCDSTTTIYNQEGCYDVIFSAENAIGCRGTTIQTNYVCLENLPRALFKASPNPAYISNPVVNFSNLSTGDSLNKWSFGGLGESNQDNPSFEFPPIEGKHNVCLEITSAGGCKDSICKSIEILDEFLIYVPSAFSPNGDGINDLFFPKLHGVLPNGFDIKIFNRWGEMVYQSNDIYGSWNGTEQNKKSTAKQDIYQWAIICIDKYYKQTHFYWGHVFLSK